MKRLVSVLVFMAMPLGIAAAADQSKDGSGSVANQEFVARTYANAQGTTLSYRLLKPADESAGKAHPLLIFLHGAGERGTDNTAQLKWGKDFMLKAGREYGAVILVPQCSPKEKWVDVDWNLPRHTMPEKPSRPMGLLLELLPEIQKECHVDPNRIYVMGLSMGGYATWDLIQRFPDRFAAAVPVCGGGDADLCAKIAKVPVWAFHGAKDPTVKPSRTRDMIEGMKKAGGDPRYTDYPEAKHDAWTPAFKEPDMLPWLFAQKKGK